MHRTSGPKDQGEKDQGSGPGEALEPIDQHDVNEGLLIPYSDDFTELVDSTDIPEGLSSAEASTSGDDARKAPTVGQAVVADSWDDGEWVESAEVAPRTPDDRGKTLGDKALSGISKRFSEMARRKGLPVDSEDDVSADVAELEAQEENPEPTPQLENSQSKNNKDNHPADEPSADTIKDVDQTTSNERLLADLVSQTEDVAGPSIDERLSSLGIEVPSVVTWRKKEDAPVSVDVNGEGLDLSESTVAGTKENGMNRHKNEVPAEIVADDLESQEDYPIAAESASVRPETVKDVPSKDKGRSVTGDPLVGMSKDSEHTHTASIVDRSRDDTSEAVASVGDVFQTTVTEPIAAMLKRRRDKKSDQAIVALQEANTRQAQEEKALERFAEIEGNLQDAIFVRGLAMRQYPNPVVNVNPDGFDLRGLQYYTEIEDETRRLMATHGARTGDEIDTATEQGLRSAEADQIDRRIRMSLEHAMSQMHVDLAPELDEGKRKAVWQRTYEELKMDITSAQADVLPQLFVLETHTDPDNKDLLGRSIYSVPEIVTEAREDAFDLLTSLPRTFRQESGHERTTVLSDHERDITMGERTMSLSTKFKPDKAGTYTAVPGQDGIGAVLSMLENIEVEDAEGLDFAVRGLVTLKPSDVPHNPEKATGGLALHMQVSGIDFERTSPPPRIFEPTADLQEAYHQPSDEYGIFTDEISSNEVQISPDSTLDALMNPTLIGSAVVNVVHVHDSVLGMLRTSAQERLKHANTGTETDITMIQRAMAQAIRDRAIPAIRENQAKYVVGELDGVNATLDSLVKHQANMETERAKYLVERRKELEHQVARFNLRAIEASAYTAELPKPAMRSIEQTPSSLRDGDTIEQLQAELDASLAEDGPADLAELMKSMDRPVDSFGVLPQFK